MYPKTQTTFQAAGQQGVEALRPSTPIEAAVATLHDDLSQLGASIYELQKRLDMATVGVPEAGESINSKMAPSVPIASCRLEDGLRNASDTVRSLGGTVDVMLRGLRV
jgi:hypothetical protein